MEVIYGLVALAGVLAVLLSFISVLWPLKGLGLPTRKRSAQALLASFILLIMIGALLPEVPDEPAAEAPGQAAQEAAPQPDAPVETAAPRPENVELQEIWMKWNSERDDYRDPDTAVFMDWENKPIRVTGLVYQKTVIPTIDGSSQAANIYFHDAGGDQELIDGQWERTGFNRGVYAQFDDPREVETVQPDTFLTMVCTGVESQTDRESGIFFGLQLQNCELETVSE